MSAAPARQSLGIAGGLRVSDITDDCAEAVRASGIRDGIASVYASHTMCAVRVNELETGILEDFSALLLRLVPGDGRAHCLSVLLGPAGESIPVSDGELCLGRWQRVLLLELDREDDPRWVVRVIGA